MEIVWATQATSVVADHAMYEKLHTMTERELIQAYMDQNLPDHEGLDEMQAINLLRHVYREIVGQQKFDNTPEMGGKDGAKVVATMFEDVMDKFFVVNGISFKTETVQKLEHKAQQVLRCTSRSTSLVFLRSDAAAFHKTGNTNSAGKAIFEGQCILCNDICTVPFKPFAGMRDPPKCLSCYRGNKLTATPDFVFDDNVYINGMPVKWLDCKCFYGSASSPFTIGLLQSQAAKYNQHFGCGAFVFAFGYCEGLSKSLEGTILLDATPLEMGDIVEFIEESHRALHIECPHNSKTKLPAPPAAATVQTGTKKAVDDHKMFECSSSSNMKTNASSPPAAAAAAVQTGIYHRDRATSSDTTTDSARKHWYGNEHLVNEMNCEDYGLNDYCYDKYGGMMGFDAWFDGN